MKRLEGNRILVTGAASGIGQATALRLLDEGATVVATDISAGILALAQRRFDQAGLANAATRVMDGENLAVAEGHYDAVISRLGLIYFPDRAAALVAWRGDEPRAGLAPDQGVPARAHVVAERGDCPQPGDDDSALCRGIGHKLNGQLKPRIVGIQAARKS